VRVQQSINEFLTKSEDPEYCYFPQGRMNEIYTHRRHRRSSVADHVLSASNLQHVQTRAMLLYQVTLQPARPSSEQCLAWPLVSTRALHPAGECSVHMHSNACCTMLEQPDATQKHSTYLDHCEREHLQCMKRGRSLTMLTERPQMNSYGDIETNLTQKATMYFSNSVMRGTDSLPCNAFAAKIIIGGIYQNLEASW
jgi:hypothetical protein